MTTMLDVRGLAKSFNGHTVLDHIDLTVAAGQHDRRRRIVRLRQDHAAATHRRIRDTRRRNGHHLRPAGREPRTCGARRTGAASATSRRTVRCSRT